MLDIPLLLAADTPPVEAAQVQEQLTVTIDQLWVIVSAVLVFLMQAGFLAFEIGAVRLKNVTATAMKNVMDWIVCGLLFVFVGFGLMFGHSAGGWIGTDTFMVSGLDAEGGSSLGVIFLVFQLAFAGAAATIVSGAMSERTGFIAYLLLAACIGTIIYPVYGHWVWGSGYFGDNSAFLADMGYVDFAGSSVVHMVGAFVALVGIKMVGARLGRYDAQGRPQSIRPHSLAWSAVGTLLLWFGWWGFNGGSTLAMNADVGPVILNTNIAAAGGGFAAFFHCWTFEKKEGIEGKMLGGILGGLVAITACCHVTTPMSSLVVGLVAGIVHNWSAKFCSETLTLDDPVGAVPVHGFCGLWGILAVALCGQEDLLPHAMGKQLGIQAFGAGVCVVWTMSVSFLCLSFIKKFVGIRVAPGQEIAGLTMSGDLPEDAMSGGASDAPIPANNDVDDETKNMLDNMMRSDKSNKSEKTGS